MAREFDPSTPLKPHTKVRSVIDLDGVPKFSDGKIELANGVTWQRYWVRFDNGEVVGHITHGDVIAVKFWDQYLLHTERTEREAAEAEALAAERAANADAGGDDGGADAGGGGAVVVNGVTVPQRLLDMSAAARIRLGA